MGFDGTSITYTATARDWGAGLMALRQRSRWGRLQWLFPVGFAALGVVNIELGDAAIGLFALITAAFIAGLLYVPAVSALLLRRQLGRLLGQPSTISLGADGLHYAMGPTTGMLGWSGVYDVIVDQRVVVITRDRRVSWAIIPRSAFASEAELDAFRDAIDAGQRSVAEESAADG